MASEEAPKKSSIIMPGQEGEQEAPPAQKRLPPDHPHRSCADCEHSFFPKNSANGQVSEGGFCRLKPPTPYTVLLPPQVQGGAPRDYTISVWPIVYQNQFCSEGFRRKSEQTQ